MNQRDQVGLLRAFVAFYRAVEDLGERRKSWRPPSKQSGRKPAAWPYGPTKAREGILDRKEN